MEEFNIDDVVVEVYESFLNKNRYIVSASHKSFSGMNAYIFVEGDGFFISLIDKRSFDERLKDATCEAINELKELYNTYLNRNSNLKNLTNKAKCYAKQCGDKND